MFIPGTLIAAEMPKLQKHGQSRNLEKMLFVNHKEDLVLDDKLRDLNMKSRLSIMDLDRERIKVRNEWRNSRKKQVTINEAISGGLVPDDGAAMFGKQPNMGSRRQSLFPKVQNNSKASDGRNATSAPPQRKLGAVDQRLSLSRGNSLIQRGHSRVSTTNQFTLQPAIPETEEYNAGYNGERSIMRQDSRDSVGTYVLNEFEKMSEVVPEILRALAKKKEKQLEADERSRIRDMKDDIDVDLAMGNLLDYEPDMNKVRKTVRSVKKLRHRMAISKRLETKKHHKSLDQMIKDKTENLGDYDEYTDGTCSLMKRRLEKKRRESASFALDPSFMQRRQSSFDNQGTPRRASVAPEAMRRGSTFPSPLARSSTTLGFGSMNRLNSFGKDSDESSPFIDEDVLVNRQRVLSEWEKYRCLQGKVEDFLITVPTGNIVLEQIVPIK